MKRTPRTGRALARVSAVQLAFGVAGLVVAVARGHPYDILGMRGRADRVGRDALFMGTAFSAPMSMLVVQTVLTARVARRADERAGKGLALLGAMMVPGYLGERQVQRRLAPSGWDRLETPLVVAGTALAATMAVLGRGVGDAAPRS